MNVKELRIGNYIESPRGIEEIKYAESLEEIEGSPDKFKGIPITEQWLIKFGFEKMEFPYLDYDMKECDLFESYWGDFYKVENYYLPRPYYFDSAFGDDFKLQHVHQLQNLHHALTGMELTIKE